MGDFTKFMSRQHIEKPLDAPSKLPSMPKDWEQMLKELKIEYSTEVPTLGEVEREEVEATSLFVGGESKALEVMHEYMKDKKRVN